MAKHLCVSAIILVFLTSGCGPNTLRDVEIELEKGGFSMWYPAEGNIETGQIWLLQGQQKEIQSRRPQNINPLGPSTTQWETLKKKVEGKLSLDASFVGGQIAAAGELKAALEAGTVKDVQLNFGTTVTERLVISDLQDRYNSLTATYKDNLRKVLQKEQGWFLISGIVKTSGMKYTVTISNKASLEAKVPVISRLLGGSVSVIWKSDTEAELVIPENQQLTIGVSPLMGKFFDPERTEMPPLPYAQIRSLHDASYSSFSSTIKGSR